MDLKKSGRFITQRRKTYDMTQKELAEKIGVTDKAISRWETGRGFPDVSILKSLSEVLGVSITEIVNGEKNISENVVEISDEAIIEALFYAKRTSMMAISITMFVLGVITVFVPLLYAGMPSVLSIFGFPLIVAGLVLFLLNKKHMKPIKKDLKQQASGEKYIKNVLKAVVAVFTVAIGLILSVYLLSDFELWKLILWALACERMGHIVYSVLRMIDKRYETKK